MDLETAESIWLLGSVIQLLTYSLTSRLEVYAEASVSPQQLFLPARCGGPH